GENTMAEQHRDHVHTWLNAMESATAQESADAAAAAVTELFEDDGYWRDLLAFSWNLTTAEGGDEIAALIRETWPRCSLSNLRIDGEVVDEGEGVLRAFFTFDSQDFHCRGVVRLRNGRAWTLLTSARELIDFPEKKGRTRELGVEHGVHPDRKNWA